MVIIEGVMTTSLSESLQLLKEFWCVDHLQSRFKINRLILSKAIMDLSERTWKE